MERDVWKSRLEELASKNLERRMRIVDGPVGPVVSTKDGEKLNFCSNDYLGLANHTEIKRVMSGAALKWGVGSASSRLVSGNTSAHERLEEEMAEYLGTEDAVVFPSGYQANVGALVALTEPGDEIFSDALVHASIVDGSRLSKAGVNIFRHRDVAHLSELLKTNDRDGLELVVTDAVFSMDGDIAPLSEIVGIAEQHDARIYLDEAHSLGVLGPGGRGLAAEFRLSDRISVRVGTFGKAFGISGAFAACGSGAAGLIRSKARSLLYTTAAPVALIEAILTSLEIVRNADDLRSALKANIEYFKNLATERNLPILDSSTAIQPVMAGSADKVMAVSSELWKLGVFVQGMRPPTVPEGTSRLRVTLTAAHEKEHIEKLIVALDDSLGKFGANR
jgi:8-amino-7-oxononanoate synthase